MMLSNGEVEGPRRSARSSDAGAQSLQRPRRVTTSRSRTPPTIVRAHHLRYRQMKGAETATNTQLAHVWYGSSKSLYPMTGIARTARRSQPPKPAAQHAKTNLNHHVKLRFTTGRGSDSGMRSNGEVEGLPTSAPWRRGRTISQRPRRQRRSASRTPPTIVRPPRVHRLEGSTSGWGQGTVPSRPGKESRRLLKRPYRHRARAQKPAPETTGYPRLQDFEKRRSEVPKRRGRFRTAIRTSTWPIGLDTWPTPVPRRVVARTT
jgi:hypothetical protein